MADDTTKLVGVDPLAQVERAQVVFEKGPETAVAAFFTIAFFFTLLLLFRSKDKHNAVQSKLQADHAKEISGLMKSHSDSMAEMYDAERERAVKHEVTMHNFLDMMDDVRFIAHEMRRVKLAREKKKETPEGEHDG